MDLPRNNVVFLLNDNKCHKKDDGYRVFDPHSRMPGCAFTDFFLMGSANLARLQLPS